METYIALLLMIVPGFIAREVYDKLNNERNQTNKFEETIIALIFSVFVLGLNFLLLIVVHIIIVRKLSDVRNLFSQFNSISFTLMYIGITIIFSIIVGFTWHLLSPILQTITDIIRKHEGKNEIIFAPSVWDLKFDDGNNHAICVIKDNKEIAKGFIGKLGHSVNSKEMYLEGTSYIDALPEYFEDIKAMYVNIDSSFVIAEYNLEKLDALIKF